MQTMTTEMRPITAIGARQTMSSLQIAELTGKQHAHVMRDIRALLEQGVNGSNFGLVEYIDKKGESRSCYQLTKTGCLILASGYSALLREKIINRWVELETAAAATATTDAGVPRTFREALLLAASQQEQIERQQRLIADQEATIRSRDAKVIFAEAVVGSRSACLVGELAKLITQNGFPIGRNRLFKWMRDNDFLGSRGEEFNIPRQRYIEMGLFELRMGVRSGHDGVIMTTVTPRVTGKGQLYFINKFIRFLAEND